MMGFSSSLSLSPQGESLDAGLGGRLRELAKAGTIPVTHAVLAEERAAHGGSGGGQPAGPTPEVPFPDALLQVSWVVQVSWEGKEGRKMEGVQAPPLPDESGASLGPVLGLTTTCKPCMVRLPFPPTPAGGVTSQLTQLALGRLFPVSHTCILHARRPCASSPPASPPKQAARDPSLAIPPEKVALLYGLACSIHFLLPPAYWYAAHYHGHSDHFEAAVLAAINSGGNNMARAALTGGQGSGWGGWIRCRGRARWVNVL